MIFFFLAKYTVPYIPICRNPSIHCWKSARFSHDGKQGLWKLREHAQKVYHIAFVKTHDIGEVIDLLRGWQQSGTDNLLSWETTSYLPSARKDSLSRHWMVGICAKQEPMTSTRERKIPDHACGMWRLLHNTANFSRALCTIERVERIACPVFSLVHAPLSTNVAQYISQWAKQWTKLMSK